MIGLGGCASPPKGGPLPDPTTTGATGRLVQSSLARLSFVSCQIVLDLEIVNPYEVDLVLVDPKYVLSIDRSFAFSSSAAMREKIPAGQSKTITLPIAVSYVELLSTNPDIKQGTIGQYSAAIDLSLKPAGSPAIMIPMTVEGEVPIPAVPNLELVDVKWRLLTMETANGTATLRMTNTNAFPLELTKLGLAISLADTVVTSTPIDVSGTLKQNQSKTFQVPLTFSPKTLAYANMHSLEGRRIRYLLEGSALANTKFGMMEFPLNFTGEAIGIR